MHEEWREVELGVLVRLGILRNILSRISGGRNRWWIASDPQGAVKTGFVTVGHGYPGCENSYNASFLRLPVLNEAMPYLGWNDLVLFFDSHAITQEFRCDLDEFSEFFGPIQKELGKRWLLGSGTDEERP